LPIRSDAHSVTLLRQEYAQSSCSADLRYSGLISLGMNVHVKFTASERTYLFVRSGKVQNGKFEYFLQQNEAPWQGMVWEDAFGKRNQVEIVRDTKATSIHLARQQLTNALASSESISLDNAASNFLAQRIRDWNLYHSGQLQRYTSGEQTRFQIVPESTSTDDPKARGRSARVR
jgi:hypothetical protein